MSNRGTITVIDQDNVSKDLGEFLLNEYVHSNAHKLFWELLYSEQGRVRLIHAGVFNLVRELSDRRPAVMFVITQWNEQNLRLERETWQNGKLLKRTQSVNFVIDALGR